MHFSQAVSIVQSQVGTIKGVQVMYSDANPLSTDLEINLSQDGMRLIFDPISQRLKMIEIYNLKLVKLKYCGLAFNSPEVAPSIEQIEHSFGATHPGVYCPDRQTYTLHFRGLSFTFPATKSQSEYYMGSTKYYRNASSSCATSVRLYLGSSERCDSSPTMPLSCYLGQLYLERAVALQGVNPPALRLHLYTEGATRSLEPKKEVFVRDVRLGDSCQDVATCLGAPNRTFYKSEDKMRIHSPNTSHKTRLALRRSDFFFNYFTLGIDILFDARTHRAKKFVLHTNYPGHYNFNMYHRCEFLMNLTVERPHKSSPGPPPTNVQKPDTVTAYTKWDTIVDKLKPNQRPVVLNRASSINTKNFFGATLCYGYKDMIFEVLLQCALTKTNAFNS
ncbi:hypothetical protein AAG570_007517 [Ranatra chinensis]|uniref:Uncharacterized protein n=1 Tax=Ranatra chinensis TaxID=642074 RepID=A0ABD0XW40_9HEMI